MRDLINRMWKWIVNAKWYLVIGLVCLVIGLGVAGYASYLVMPVKTTRLENVWLIADVNKDGVNDIVVSADVILSVNGVENNTQNPLP